MSTRQQARRLTGGEVHCAMTATARRWDDGGQLSLGASITIPGIFLLLALVIMAGRVADANGSVQSAANEAARAASISRTAADAQAAAQAAVAVTLGSSDLDCTSTVVAVDLSGFAAPLGQDAPVVVTVTCTVPLSQLVVLGVGDQTISATAVSMLDVFRSRQ